MAPEPPNTAKRLDQCANCSVPVGGRITDEQGKVDMSRTSNRNSQAKVSAFIINADGRQNKIRVTDALKEVYKLNLLNNNNNNNNIFSGTGHELFLCYNCSLIFPKLYKLFHDFYSLRKADSILAQNLIEIENLMGGFIPRGASGEEQNNINNMNISVRRDIFEPETALKEPAAKNVKEPFPENFDGAGRSSNPTFYLEPSSVNAARKGRPLSSLYIKPEADEEGGGTEAEGMDFTGEISERDLAFKFAGKTQRQYYSKPHQGFRTAQGRPKQVCVKEIRMLKTPQALLASAGRRAGSSLMSFKGNPRPSNVIIRKSLPKLKVQANVEGQGASGSGEKEEDQLNQGNQTQVVVKEEPLEEIHLQHFLDPTSTTNQGNKGEKAMDSLLQCPNCTRPFSSEFLLKCHREYCRSAEEIRDLVPTKKKPKCPACSKICGDERLLLEHIKLRHRSVRSFSCGLCGLNLKSEKALNAHNVKSHKNNVEEDGSMKCEDCEFRFTTKRLLMAHRTRVHSPGPPKLSPAVGIDGARRSARRNKGQHRYKSRLDL